MKQEPGGCICYGVLKAGDVGTCDSEVLGCRMPEQFPEHKHCFFVGSSAFVDPGYCRHVVQLGSYSRKELEMFSGKGMSPLANGNEKREEFLHVDVPSLLCFC